jgi:hypothetical protein
MKMKTATRFGTDKSDAGIALRSFEGFGNRRAWEALLFCYHPRHQGARDAHGVDTLFTVILPTPVSTSSEDLATGMEFGWIVFAAEADGVRVR